MDQAVEGLEWLFCATAVAWLGALLSLVLFVRVKKACQARRTLAFFHPYR
jgi:hypothetical protein